MRAEFCKIDFYDSWAEHCECEFMRNEHYECEFYESRELQMWILQELSIYLNFESEFMRAEHCKCEFSESWGLQI